MAKTIRMSDIAKELGVSTVTVSKALSNQKGVSEPMRMKIKELAEEMGYKPPASVKSQNRKSFHIGVLVLEAYIEKYVTFYWEMYQNINMEAAKQNCFVMLEIISLEDEEQRNLPKLILEERVDGLMILGGVQTGYLKRIHEECELPVVYMDFYDAEEQDDCVISNSFYGTYHLTNYLFSMGHKDIAFVGTPLITDSITDRYLGYLKSMMENGRKVMDQWIIPDRDTTRVCYETIALPDVMPTAFVCNCDLTASKLIKSLQDAGYQVPMDVSVVGYDDYIYPGLCEVEITTYSVDMEQMARTGIRSLVKKITGEKYQKGHHIVEGKLVLKASVKNLNET